MVVHVVQVVRGSREGPVGVRMVRMDDMHSENYSSLDNVDLTKLDGPINLMDLLGFQVTYP